MKRPKKPQHRHALLEVVPKRGKKSDRIAKRKSSTQEMSITKRLKKNLRIVSKVVDEDEEESELISEDESVHAEENPDVEDVPMSVDESIKSAQAPQKLTSKRAPGDEQSRMSYERFANDLKDYTYGKLPREIVMLVRHPDWCDMLLDTNPLGWSAQACYEITNHFISNMDHKQLTSYHLNIHLPIFLYHTTTRKTESKKLLHPSRFRALQKSLFKPNAFVDGFLVPLSRDCDVNSRQALIIAGLIQKHKFPRDSASRAMKILADLPYTPALAILMRSFIEKRLQFGDEIIVTITNYFTRFHKHEEKMPVLWNQLLLSFVTVFGAQVPSEQKVLLRKVAWEHQHEGIISEIIQKLK